MSEPDLYKRLKLLGEGSFGKAYLAECVADKTLCVLKQVDLTQMKEEERRETIKEARILEALRHPNIVKFREVYKTKKGRLCIIMDYADGGDLSQKVRDAGTQLISEYQILDWFTQICLALKHVHDRKIIHRDLKSQNIFLTKEGIIKMGDFGIARVLNHTREKCKTMVGTPYYLSPEIIDSKDYSFKTDIWSLGVILYELCALKPPFNAESLHGLALKIVRGQYPPLPDRYSTDVKNLVKSLLNVDPLRRPSIHEVLKMPVIVNRIRSVLSDSVRNLEFSHTILHKQNFVNHNLIVPYDDDIARKRNQIQSQPVLKSNPYGAFNKQRPAYQEYQRPVQSQAQLAQASPIERGQPEQKSPYGVYGFMAGYAPQPVDRYNAYQNQNRFNILKDKKPSVSPMRGPQQQQAPARDKSPLDKLPQVQPQNQAAQAIPQPIKPRKIEQPLMIQECQMNNRYAPKEQQKSPLQRIQSAQQQLNQLANKENIEKPAQSHFSCEPDTKMKDSHMILNDLRQQKNKDKDDDRSKMRQDIRAKRDQLKQQKTIPAEDLFVSTPSESVEEKDSQPSPPKSQEDDQIKILAELEGIVNNVEDPMVCEVISECAEVTTQQDISDREDGESFEDADEREDDDQTHIEMIRTILLGELGAEQLEKSIQLYQKDQIAFYAQNNQYDALVALLECMQHLKIDYLK